MEAYELEDRVLYDAAGVVTALAGDLSDTLNDMTALDVLPQEPLAPQELVIIDSGIADQDSYIEGKANTTYIKIDESSSLSDLVTEISQFTNLYAIHVISQGEENNFQLAGQTVSSSSLESNQDILTVMESMGDALNDSGDIFLHGFETVSEDNAFLQALEEITDADVSAADDFLVNDDVAEESYFSSVLEGESRKVFIIDMAVDGYESFITAAQDNNAEIVLIQEGEGVEEVFTALARFTEVDELHIYSHGSEGSFALGVDTVDSAKLGTDFLSQFSSLNEIMSEAGDVLIYGCNVAEDTGSNFIVELASITGADIAASNDLTGNAEQSANWVLEVEEGIVEANEVTSGDFEGILSTFPLNLRDAIIFNQVTDWSHHGASTFTLLDGAVRQTSSQVNTGDTYFVSNDPANYGSGDISFTLADGTGGPDTAWVAGVVIGDYLLYQTNDNSRPEFGIKRISSYSSNSFNSGTSLKSSTLNDEYIYSDEGDEYDKGIRYNTSFSYSSSEITYTVVSKVRFGKNDDVITPVNHTFTLTAAEAGVQSFKPSSFGVMLNGLMHGDNLLSSSLGVSNIQGLDTTVNFAPNANDDSLATNEDTPQTINVVSNDTDSDSDSLSVSSVTNGSKGTVTFSGQDVTYTPFENATGTDSFTYTVSDGNDGFDTATVNVTISAVNDAPVHTVPVAQTVDEDTDLFFSGATLISVVDVDSSTESVVTTLSVNDGVLTLASQDNLSVTGNDSGLITLTGSVADINAALDNLKYRGNLHFNGSSTLTISTDDQGNTGSGGALSDTDTIAIIVSAVNDAPVHTVPVAQTVDEDTDLVFSGATRISVVDVDSSTESVITILSVNDGILTLASQDNLSVTGNGSGLLTLTGSVVDINAALDNLTYRGSLNFKGSDTLTITTDDQGNTGSGGALSDSASIGITVAAINDAPVHTVPVAQVVDEDTDLVFSGATRISLVDVDSSTAIIVTSMNVNNGILTLASQENVSVTGNGSGSIILTGSVVDINAALDNLTFRGNSNFNGSSTLTIHTDDQGNIGSGGDLSDTDTIAITVGAINDGPVFNGGSSSVLSTPEDTALTLNISDYFGDIDGDNLSIQSVSSPNGSVINNNDGTFTFTSSLNFNGSTSIEITVEDTDNETASTSIALTVTAVNDAPVHTVPVAQIVDEDTDLFFSGATRISLVDVDISSTENVITTLSVNDGFLTLATQEDLVVIGNGSDSLTLIGTVSDINAALDNLKYRGSLNFNGSDTLTITTNDQGNNGSGGALSDSDNIGITVSAINDTPVHTVPVGQSVNEDTDLVFSGATRISLVDVDSSTESVITTLSVNEGILTLASQDNLSVAGNGSGSITLTGSVADINAALDNLKYRGSLNFNGSDTLTITTDDQGNTGSGGALSDSDSIAITVSAVNDASDSISSSGISMTEDTTLTLNINSFFSDPDGDTLSIQSVSSPNGIVINNNDGTFTFTPSLNFNGSTSVEITVEDSGGATASGSIAITVSAVNDAPVHTVPVGQSVNEDTDLVFSGATRISLVDVDSSTESVITTLSVNEGILTLASQDNLSVTGNGSGSITLTGSVADINAALDNLKYRGSLNFNGSDTLTITTDDQGNTGSGGALSDSDSIAITVSAVNDASDNVSSSGISMTEDTTLTLDINSFFSDPDGDTLSIQSVSSANGIVINNNDGTFTFTPSLNFNGSTSVEVTVEDTGGATASGSIGISVLAVNDAPVHTVPVGQSVNEDTDLFFSGATRISLIDVDTSTESVVTTLSVNGGILTLASQDNLSVTGNGSGSITLTGSVVDINAALDNLKYHGDLNSNGSDTLTITTNDQGNTGSGNALSDTDTIVITITGVNDAPVLQIGSPADTGIAGGNETTPEDTPLILNIADYVFDADGDLLTVVSNVVGNGSIIDNGNGTITYSPVLNFNGSDNIELEVTDGEFSVTVTIPLLVTEVNDAPVAGEDVGEVMLTQTGTYSVLDNDTDIDGSSLEVISASAPYGSVTVNPDNTISYTANHNTLGFVSITYKIRDEHGLESSAVLRINVKEELNNRVDSPGGFVFSLGSRVEEGRASNLANSIQLKDGEYSVNDPSSVSVKTISDESVTQESEHSVASLKQSIDFDVQLQNSGEIPLIQGVDQPETGQAVEVDTIENTNIQFNQQIDNIINSFID